ncbi:TPA: oligoendopeptidase F [Streptococcus pyogenes]|uniref:Putative oligoendopeptidase F n=1 Tax=Streptococcus pyogenes serotype M49 (strain NZ131) TaxID=471876 RepID=A0A0H3BY19_STRPZ|nr:oligoendopeptidase F [Streptococcus pyogenes]HER4566896.1 oligoendopeptidase F [Streptococcus pyogenes NGAS629]HER4574416.1 oligoendopeptidase F [Streptococcus pyogenes NGAS643]HER4578689.1 oligoendopeptidase F [Streptococcus pyogenes NGAS633]HER4583140.1 oligoendopeptidase F [Streptococcus pyogenes NGAS655]HER4603973.1 oligoendopeptidase F [Streptococcus pyogenes NGAS620]HER4713975.1 oligoendopeptidase F [Streptococcus pyogenes NGAS320]HER4717431.1 oligoendopeptidase F [Streptococcus pyo
MELKKRSEFPENELWDLTALYKDRQDFLLAIEKALQDIDLFKRNYEGRLTSVDDFTQALIEIEHIYIQMSHIGTYAFMPQTTDFSDESFAQIAQAGDDFMTKASVALSFFDTALANADLDVLDTLEKNPYFSAAIRMAKIQKEHLLSPDVEKALANLREVINAPYDIYTKMRAGDFDMDDFEVDGKTYKNSFVSYENFYQNHENAEIREKAFRSFSKGLRKHQNTAAAAYLAKVKSEKLLADMKGYASVFDYLLAEQEVDRSLFDRQIDLIMTEFGPVAQKFLKHVAQVNGLEKMTFADWKLDIDNDLNPEVSIDGAYDLVMKSLAPLGQEYTKEIERYQTERWVDFAANANKDSGGYAADPYKVHPYVLMSWTGRMSDVYTLIHEIGHSGQFIFSDNHQSYFNTHMSTYYVEAPSTFNELMLSDYLEHQFDDPRQKRFALAHRLTDTYFHNFITHLLEAAFQRKVYTLIEEGGTFGADQLNAMMKEVLTDFWGDAVDIDDDAALTWMRQAHYYMGLYSYTYSAGLVMSTAGYLNLKNNPDGAKEWLDFLKSGGSRTPFDTAMLIGADIATEKPLRDTIQFLSNTVDQIINYTEEMSHA